MELRHLRYFVVTAQTQHFTRAAELLGMAQPPLSQQIRELEREIGTPLFDRVGRGVALSDAGRAFLPCAQDILARVAEAGDVARRAARGEVGVLRLGFTESASFNDTVTGAISRYQQAHPEVELRLEESQSENLVQGLAAGDLDAAFVRPPFALSGAIRYLPLNEENLIAALPSGHPLASQKRLTLADLRHERFIDYSRKSGYGLSADIIAACRRQGFNPTLRQRAPQLSSAVNLVAAGIGVAVVPASMRHMRARGIHYLPLDLDWPRAVLGLAVRRAERAAVVDNLLRLLNITAE
ncbi:LysR family transcriptional regulator [Bordetella genomosp. 12]|uniref:LysR family transcriptional regulator n=1 Tax=Bordetella genomosp. 12 TaxID=463035 RepID=A0A261VWD9_9BORD|nr:LysR family transcriptional regulator [Bordetella genomosp. 12]OZI77920.1 LysR family transcriptional regulator [Bordetella genomosp. 12]